MLLTAETLGLLRVKRVLLLRSAKLDVFTNASSFAPTKCKPVLAKCAKLGAFGAERIANASSFAPTKCKALPAKCAKIENRKSVKFCADQV